MVSLSQWKMPVDMDVRFERQQMATANRCLFSPLEGWLPLSKPDCSWVRPGLSGQPSSIPHQTLGPFSELVRGKGCILSHLSQEVGPSFPHHISCCWVAHALTWLDQVRTIWDGENPHYTHPHQNMSSKERQLSLQLPLSVPGKADVFEECSCFANVDVCRRVEHTPEEAAMPKKVCGLISYLSFPLYMGKLVSHPKVQVWQDWGKHPSWMRRSLD